MSYTKGEWIAREDFSGWAIIQKPTDYLPGTVFIAQEINQGKDGGKADAKLMSAAPDLLEALQEVIRISSDRNHVVWDKAKAAIKKATLNS